MINRIYEQGKLKAYGVLEHYKLRDYKIAHCKVIFLSS